MLIGLCGYSKAGKDTLAELVKDKFTRKAFADELKSEVGFMLNALGIEADLWGKDKEHYRDLLVAWGRIRRSEDKNYWVKEVLSTLSAGRSYVITDVRYVNEVEAIQNAGGIVFMIKRQTVGPANEEERQSFDEIYEKFPGIPLLWNDSTPEALKQRFESLLLDFQK